MLITSIFFNNDSRLLFRYITTLRVATLAMVLWSSTFVTWSTTRRCHVSRERERKNLRICVIACIRTCACILGEISIYSLALTWQTVDGDSPFGDNDRICGSVSVSNMVFFPSQKQRQKSSILLRLRSRYHESTFPSAHHTVTVLSITTRGTRSLIRHDMVCQARGHEIDTFFKTILLPSWSIPRS